MKTSQIKKSLKNAEEIRKKNLGINSTKNQRKKIESKKSRKIRKKYEEKIK